MSVFIPSSPPSLHRLTRAKLEVFERLASSEAFQAQYPNTQAWIADPTGKRSFSGSLGWADTLKLKALKQLVPKEMLREQLRQATLPEFASQHTKLLELRQMAVIEGTTAERGLRSLGFDPTGFTAEALSEAQRIFEDADAMQLDLFETIQAQIRKHPQADVSALIEALFRDWVASEALFKSIKAEIARA